MAVPKRTALTWPARAAVEAAQEPAQSDRMSCTPCTSCHWRLMNTCTISRAVLLPAAPHALSHTSVHNIGCKLHLSCRLLLPQAALPSILRCWHTAVLQSRATRRRGNTSSRTRTDGRTGASTGERRSRPESEAETSTRRSTSYDPAPRPRPAGSGGCMHGGAAPPVMGAWAPAGGIGASRDLRGIEPQRGIRW